MIFEYNLSVTLTMNLSYRLYYNNELIKGLLNHSHNLTVLTMIFYMCIIKA